jgi:hypothetical protein
MTALLGEVLGEVGGKVGRYGGRRTIGEQNTKASLVEPVLRALGWAVDDSDEVQREFKRKKADKPVDYALLISGEPRVLIEAKALNQTLAESKWALKILDYASNAQVGWIVLTDGNEYRVYNSRAKGPIERRLFRAVRITDPGSRATETLDLLSKEKVMKKGLERAWERESRVKRQLIEAIQALFSPSPDPALVRLLKERTGDISCSEMEANLSRVLIEVNFHGERRQGRMEELMGYKRPYRVDSIAGVALQVLLRHRSGMTADELKEAVIKRERGMLAPSVRTEVTRMLREARGRGVPLEVDTTREGGTLYRVKRTTA